MLYRAEDFRKVKWSTSASSPAALACLITNIYPLLHFPNAGEKAVRGWKTATQIKDTVRCKSIFWGWATVSTICTHHNWHVMTRVMYCRSVPAFISPQNYSHGCTKHCKTRPRLGSLCVWPLLLWARHYRDCKKRKKRLLISEAMNQLERANRSFLSHPGWQADSTQV